MNRLGSYCYQKSLLSAAAVFVMLGAGTAQQSSQDLRNLVRTVVQNELKPTPNDPRFMYKDSTQWKDHSVTNEVIQTDQGGLSRPITRNGHPLTPDEKAQADQNLKKFATDADARRRKREADKEGDQRADNILRSLPDAFHYTVLGSEKGKNGHELVKLGFKADPNWSAPSRETRVLEGMQGNILIDKTAMRLAEINGELFKDVEFGWGILGKLDQGGKFIIHQADVGEGHWEMIEETLRFDGKILMVKPLRIWSTETMTDFRPVPRNLTTSEALQLLQKSDEVVAQNGGGTDEKRK